MSVDKLVDSTQLNADLTSVANAIRTKGGTSADLTFPSEFVSAVEAIETGGGIDYLELLCNNQLTIYESTEAENIPQRLFYQQTALTSANFPNATSMGEYAFYECTNLENINCPKITALKNYAFQNCSKLCYYDFSNIISLNGTNGFQNTALTGIYAPKATAVGSFGASQFSECKSLIYARFPANIGLTRSSAFSGCTTLKLVDMGKSTQISSVGSTFYNCTALEVLILRKTESITPCGAINAFNNVGTTIPVKVYVPSALIPSYQTETNWSTLYTNGQLEFLALEGSPYEANDFIYEGVPT